MTAGGITSWNITTDAASIETLHMASRQTVTFADGAKQETGDIVIVMNCAKDTDNSINLVDCRIGKSSIAVDGSQVFIFKGYTKTSINVDWPVIDGTSQIDT